MRSLFRLFSLLGVFVGFLCPLRCISQTPPNDYLDRVGIPDWSVNEPVEMGAINLANGNLHLEIPMASLAQRGEKPFGVKLVYDSTIWGHSWPTVWYPNAMIGSLGGWRVITTGFEGDSTICQAFLGGTCVGVNSGASDGTCTVSVGPVTGTYTTFSGFSYHDATGLSKNFPDIYTYSSPTPSLDCPPDTPNGAGYADDGSGYFISITDYFHATVYDNFGRIVSDLVKDANGNGYGLNSNGIVDLVGRNPVIKTVNGNLTYYDILNSQGGRSRYTVATTTINVHTAFGQAFMTEYSGQLTVVQSLTLPNGRSYTFDYDAGTAPGNYGQLKSMTLPGGSTIQYTYTTFLDSQSRAARWVASRTSEGNLWTYTPTGPGAGHTVTVVRPDQTSASYAFTVPELLSGAYNIQATYSDRSGNAVQTVTKEYIQPPTILESSLVHSYFPSRITTTIPKQGSTLTKKTEYSWFLPNVSEVREWDFYTGTAPATPTRVTDATYTADDPAYAPNYVPKTILSRPTSITVKSGTGSIAFQAKFEYDNYTNGISASGAVQHDSTFNTAYLRRGNLTAIQRWRNTDGAWLTTRNQYDDAGNITSTTDPGLHTTSFSYTDSWGDTHCVPVGGNAAAFRTTVTNALNQTTQSKYNSCTGTVGSTTDLNNQTTDYAYNDPLDRQTQVTLPTDSNGNRSQTTKAYNEATLPLSITTTASITPTMNKISNDILDGIGRPITQVLASDPLGASYSTKTLDFLGRPSKVYNATRCNPPATNCGESTWAYASFSYDTLNRTAAVASQDGGITATAYDGNATTVTDQAGKQRRSIMDGLGRLVEVDEPGPSSVVTKATGWVTVDGNELAGDSGTVSISINGGGAYIYNYGATDTTGTIASGLANLINSSSGSLVQATASPSANISIVNFGFESPAVGTYQYNPSSAGWTFAGYSGISGNGSGFTWGNPAAPEGAQVAFLQMGSGSVISQSLSGFQAGTNYAVTFYAAQRGNVSAGGQDFDVYLDSTLIDTFRPTGTSYSSYSTHAFTATTGSHTLKFVGRDSSGGDNTAFIDSVRVVTTPVANMGFETPVVGAGNHQYGPVGGSWTFAGNSGISGNGSGFTFTNPAAPEGVQIAFLQMGSASVISQSISGFLANTNYVVTFYAAQRANISQGGQDFDVYLDSTFVDTFRPTGTSYSLYSTHAFTTTAGTHTLKFVGRDSSGGDNTAFIDAVRLSVPSSSTISLVAKTPGSAANSYTVTATTTYSIGQSFTATTSGTLSGGLDAVSSNPLVTLYTYDLLDNLICAEQHGGVTGTGCSSPPSSDATSPWRVRRFTYDSLSHMLTAKNPESGTAIYVYDADGELLQKTSPAPNQTGSATQTISYCYDQLHRVKGRAYSAQSCPLTSPVVTYTYDVGTNGKGHLTSLTDQAGSATFAYDPLGRLLTETRVLTGANNAAISKTISYTHNLDNSVKTLTYPSQKVITYAPDAAGRSVSAIDSASAINYVTGATYAPDNSLTGFISGNTPTFAGITNAFSYNKRFQPITMSAASPSQTVFSISYDFQLGNGDNENVWAITNNKDTTRSQAFTYDSLNRLISAQNTGTDCTVTVLGGNKKFWGNSYGYDAWGNLLAKSVTKCTAENLSVVAGNDNRLQGAYTYDAAGNIMHDANNGLNYTWDPENRLTGANGYTYTYDVDDNRVRKSNGNLAANGTLYWYMTPGVVAETDLAGTTKSEYIFFNGTRVARRDGPTGAGGVFYYFSDHLKTASVITDSAGVIKSESDYYPWGGELQFVNNDTNDYKFTGKKRDTETGLDYFGARYYSSAFSRFLSVDAGPLHWDNPQSLNRYTFTLNNPLRFIDADGNESIPPALLQHIINFNSYAKSLEPQARDTVRSFATSGGNPVMPSGLSGASHDILARAWSDYQSAGSNMNGSATEAIQNNIINTAATNLSQQIAADTIQSQLNTWTAAASTTTADLNDAFRPIQNAIDAEANSTANKVMGFIGHATNWISGPISNVVQKLNDAGSYVPPNSTTVQKNAKDTINRAVDAKTKDDEKKKQKENEAQNSGS
jgi:RHS repeat-associated protein